MKQYRKCLFSIISIIMFHVKYNNAGNYYSMVTMALNFMKNFVNTTKDTWKF